MRVIFSAVVILLTFAAPGVAEDASVAYEARYRLTGYFLRAANVCMANAEQIRNGFVFVETQEMRAFSRAFPKVTQDWMIAGADWFNASVMQKGMQPACDTALAYLKKANQRP